MNKYYYIYTRILYEKNWLHPDFAKTNIICLNKWKNPNNNYEFLCELSENIDIDKYSDFLVSEVNYEDVKQMFVPKIYIYTKNDFLKLLSSEEYVNFKKSLNFEVIRFYDILLMSDEIDISNDYNKSCITLMKDLNIILTSTYDFLYL